MIIPFLILFDKGDDCISIVSGSKNVMATNIVCGPGHGIRCATLLELQQFINFLHLNLSLSLSHCFFWYKKKIALEA